MYEDLAKDLRTFAHEKIPRFSGTLFEACGRFGQMLMCVST